MHQYHQLLCLSFCYSTARFLGRKAMDKKSHECAPKGKTLEPLSSEGDIFPEVVNTVVKVRAMLQRLAVAWGHKSKAASLESYENAIRTDERLCMRNAAEKGLSQVSSFLNRLARPAELSPGGISRAICVRPQRLSADSRANVFKLRYSKMLASLDSGPSGAKSGRSDLLCAVGGGVSCLRHAIHGRRGGLSSLAGSSPLAPPPFLPLTCCSFLLPSVHPSLLYFPPRAPACPAPLPSVSSPPLLPSPPPFPPPSNTFRPFLVAPLPTSLCSALLLLFLLLA